MSFIAEVQADGSGKWYSNGLAFATFEEANHYGSDLMSRWFAVRDMRVVESEKPVTHRWVDGEGLAEVNSDAAPRMPARRVSI